MKVDCKWGFIDKTGRLVISPQYNYADEFHNGLAAVLVGGKWGFIDKSGQMVIQPRFTRAGRFSSGVAQVSIANKWGLIDSTGKLIWGLEEINTGACRHCLNGPLLF